MSDSPILLAAKASKWVYSDTFTSGALRIAGVGATGTIITIDDVSVGVLETANLIVIAFRGTELLSLEDWYHNIDISLTPLCSGKLDCIGKAHNGYLQALRIVSKPLQSLLDTYPSDKKIMVTGHSQGAGIASLYVAANILTKDIDSLITFGSPRCLNKESAKYLDEVAEYRGTKLLRVVNNNDIVTRLPSKILHPAYTHLSNQLYITSRGEIIQNPRWFHKLFYGAVGRWDDLFKMGTDGIKDHLITNYIEILERNNL